MPTLISLLEEVVPAVELALPREALLVQCALTLGALNTLHMPRLVQHLHQKAFHDRLLAASAHERCDHVVFPSLFPGRTFLRVAKLMRKAVAVGG